ncbi:MAG TPA: GNAT family N-acetyltransferase [Alphaproteobacteria bacterium]|nr:GNAT family N-acetyltransferase [Alphaproteobacteria bacterium]
MEAIITLSAFVQRQHADALPGEFKLPVESQQTRNAFKGFLTDPASLMLLVEDGRPAGYLWAQFQNRPDCWARFAMQLLYIQHIVVAPNFRQRGIGSLLLNKAVEIAQQKGIKRVELDVWAFNIEAQRFYAKRGFEVFNERMALRVP